MPAARSHRLVSVTIDCGDLEPVVAFYEQLLGMERTADDGAGWAQLTHPDGGLRLNLQSEPGYAPPTWPEVPGRQAKMLHLEVEVDDVPAAVTVARAAGGREAAWQPPDRDPARLRVVLDPAGHPLCLFATGS